MIRPRDAGSKLGFPLRAGELLGIILCLENMRCYVTLAQTFAELETHECTRGIARGLAVVTLFQVGDHREVGVTYGGVQVKAVVVCDQRNRLADAAA